MPKFCTNCGGELRPQAKFCTSCGSQLAGGLVGQVEKLEAPPSPLEEAKGHSEFVAPTNVVESEAETQSSTTPKPTESSIVETIGSVSDEAVPGRKAKRILVAAVIVLCLGAGAFWLFIENRARDAVTEIVEFDPASYTDNFLSEANETASVSGTARIRNYPTTKRTSVISTLKSGEAVNGRWVSGADPSSHWLRVNLDGDVVGYVWEGNLRLPEEASGSWRYISTFGDYDSLLNDELVGKIVALTIGPMAARDRYEYMNDQKVIEHRDGVDKNMVMVASACNKVDCERWNWSIWLSLPNKYSMICLSENGKAEYYRKGNVVLTLQGRCPRNGGEYSEDAINIR